MSGSKRILVISVEDDGKKISFSYEVFGAIGHLPAERQKFHELTLYSSDDKWSDGNYELVGKIVLGALSVFPKRTEAEKAEDQENMLAIIAKLEDEERRGLFDDSSLKNRAILEFIQYNKTGKLQHFINGDKLYKRLLDAGSAEHLKIKEIWESALEKFKEGGNDLETE